jgi:hypothetical protein
MLPKRVAAGERSNSGYHVRVIACDDLIVVPMRLVLRDRYEIKDSLREVCSMKSSANLKDEHPVKRELLSHVSDALRRNGNVRVEEVILKHGRPFIGIKRPKGYRQRAIKNCFANAGELALAGRGIYVEGYANVPGQPPVHHAWVTSDGVHAIDTTFSDPAPNCLYFGIPFAREVLKNWIIHRKTWGMLDAAYPIKEMEELLEDVGRQPAIFQID